MHSPRHLIAPMLILGAAACTDVGEHAGLDAAPETEAAPSVVRPASLWRKDALSVCFETYPTYLDGDPGGLKEAEAHRWIQQAVESTWERVSKIDFTGWGPCPNRNPGVADITIGRYSNRAGGGTSAFGTESLAGYPSMFIGMLCEASGEHCVPTDPTAPKEPPPWAGHVQLTGPCLGSTGSVPPAERQLCVGFSAVHEFGHALALLHEHERVDAPKCLVSQNEPVIPAGPGFQPLWPYDPLSVMNYCSPNRYKVIAPTPRDILSVASLYSPQVMTYDLDAFNGVRRVYGPGVHLVTHPVRSLVAAPGLQVRICTASGCTGHNGINSTLPYAAITRLEISPTAVVFNHPGYQGESRAHGIGTFTAAGGSLCDNCIASVVAPAGLAVELCDTAAGAACTPVPVQPDNLPSFTLPAAIDRKASLIKVSPRTVLFNERDFRGAGTSHAQTANAVLPVNSASSVVVIPGSSVHLCAAGFWGLPLDCKTFTASANLPPELDNKVRWITFSYSSVANPPNTN